MQASEGTLKLAGGTIRSGRVELCKSGTWGTVCHNEWGNNDATVVCHQLGFSRHSELATTINSLMYIQGGHNKTGIHRAFHCAHRCNWRDVGIAWYWAHSHGQCELQRN